MHSGVGVVKESQTLGWSEKKLQAQEGKKVKSTEMALKDTTCQRALRVGKMTLGLRTLCPSSRPPMANWRISPSAGIPSLVTGTWHLQTVVTG